MSIPTPAIASLLHAPRWLEWSASNQDGPILVLLGLVLLLCGLGVAWRRRRP